MTASVQLPSALREYTDGLRQIETDAATVALALDELARAYPALRRHLFTDTGALRGFVRVYLNNDDVRDLERGDMTALREGDTILIVPSIAGGDHPRGGARSGDRAPGGAGQPNAAQPNAAQPNAAQPNAAQPNAAQFSPAELTRYARHFALPDVGPEGQARLREASVLVVGAGGLGSPVLMYLAAAGVGTIGIVDGDVIDLTNLQRQVLYGTADIGRRKAAVAAERIGQLNPHVRTQVHDTRITRVNAMDILRGYDVVIDGTDNFPTRYLLNDACVMLAKPYVYGSILRFEGQVSVFTGRGAPCYRCLFREPPPPGLVPSCAEGGVLGVLPGIIGSLQALEAMKLIMGRGDTLVGRLALFDALAFHWRELKLRRNVNCPVCGDQPTVTELIDYDEFCGLGGQVTEQQGMPQITAAELKERLDRGDDIALVDVREPFEWDIANLEPHGATLIPLDQVADRKNEIPTDRDVVIYCRSGSRSAGAIRQLRALGYDRLINLKGGINGWAEEVDPDMPTY